MTDNRIRDFSIYLWMMNTGDIAKVSSAFNLSKSRIRQIVKAVDRDYTGYSVPYWQHVEAKEQTIYD